MGRLKNELLYQKFGRLIVIAEKASYGGHARWLCLCTCGQRKICRASHLISGNIKSCGCWQRAEASKRLSKYASSRKHKGKNNPAFTHGKSNTPLYKVWAGMKSRCNTKSSGNYYRYGKKNIKIEWDSFTAFYKDMAQKYQLHVKKHGRKNTTIDRISPGGNYSKENCRWATWSQQALNRRRKNHEQNNK